MKTTLLKSPDEVKSKLRRLSILALILTLVGACIGFGQPETSAMLGALAPGALVQGTPDTHKVEAASPGIHLPSLDKKVALIYPDKAPLDAMIRQAPTTSINSWTRKFYEVSQQGDKVVTSTSTAQTNGGMVLPVIDATGVQIDDLFIVNTVASIAGGLPLIIQVYDKQGTNLSVIAVNGTEISEQVTTIPAISANTEMHRFSNAKDETTAQTAVSQMIPTSEFNYCQRFMTQSEIGIFEEDSDREVDFNLDDFQLAAMYRYRQQNEKAALIGARKKIFDPRTEQWKYTMGGVINYVGHLLDYSITGSANALNYSKFIDYTERVYSETNGSDSRYFFAGTGLISTIQKIPEVQKQLEARKTEIVFGLKFSVIDTYFGPLYLKQHKGMSQMGMNNDGFILDMNNIKKCIWKSLNWRDIDLINSGQKMANASVLEETYTIQVNNALAHAYIKAQP